MDTVLEVVVSVVASLGGLGLVKFLFFMNPEKRKAEAEARLKELEVYKGKLDVALTLIDTLKQRIEQQDDKIKELNEKVDSLYEEKHCLERENNELVRENAMLKIELSEAKRNVCLRPDDECMKRQPPRDHCRLKRLANGFYDKFYTAAELEKGEADCDEEDKLLFIKGKEAKDEVCRLPEEPDQGRHA